MSAPDRREMLDRADKTLSIRRQCMLLGVARSGVYRPRRPANDNDLALMRRIDELFTAWPFLGSRRMTEMLKAEGETINRKRVQRLMRKMGIAALGPKPNTTKPAPGHKIFPYLLRHLKIERGPGLAHLQYDGHNVLRRRARRRPGAVWQAGDFQHRPRLTVHQRRLHRRAGGRRGQDLHGRPGPVDGQRLHRAAVALIEA
jgi:putative transposase